MPRIARGLVSGFVYHVLNCGNAARKSNAELFSYGLNAGSG